MTILPHAVCGNFTSHFKQRYTARIVRLPGSQSELYEAREQCVLQMRWFEHFFGLVPHFFQQILEVLGRLDRLHAAQRSFRLYADHAAPDLVLDETPHLKSHARLCQIWKPPLIRRGDKRQSHVLLSTLLCLNLTTDVRMYLYVNYRHTISRSISTLLKKQNEITDKKKKKHPIKYSQKNSIVYLLPTLEATVLEQVD